MMSNITGIGIIGCGTISRAHFAAIQSQSGMQIIAVADQDYGKAEAAAKELGCKAYEQNLDLISDPKVQAVVLLTPPGYHYDLITMSALHHKHVLAEKPIGVDLNQINSCIKVCEENGVLLSVISQHRFDPATIFAREKIKKNAIGKVIGANCIVNWFRDDMYYNSWRKSKHLAGGGVLAIQAIHTIDLMLWLAGEVDSVKGYVDRTHHASISVEDTAMACFKFKNGGLGVISATTSTFPGYPAKLDILGTDGSITIEGDQVTFYQSRVEEEAEVYTGMEKGNTVADPAQVSIETMAAQYENFIQAIQQGSTLIVTSDEAKKAFLLMDAIYRSSESGEEIKLYELMKK
jgi:UDP-N-acetyl-2-amino-2-deoxyglucuronate dehydrogenase